MKNVSSRNVFDERELHMLIKLEYCIVLIKKAGLWLTVGREHEACSTDKKFWSGSQYQYWIT